MCCKDLDRALDSKSINNNPNMSGNVAGDLWACAQGKKPSQGSGSPKWAADVAVIGGAFVGIFSTLWGLWNFGPEPGAILGGAIMAVLWYGAWSIIGCKHANASNSMLSCLTGGEISLTGDITQSLTGINISSLFESVEQPFLEFLGC